MFRLARDCEGGVGVHDPAIVVGQDRDSGRRQRMQRGIRQAGAGIGGRQPREPDRVRDEILEAVALEFRGRSIGRRLSDEHANAQPPFARTFELFDFAQAHAGGERFRTHA